MPDFRHLADTEVHRGHIWHVVVAEFEGRRAGLTMSSLVSLSLDPPLVGISLAHVASLYEVLRDAGEWAVSILSGDQEAIGIVLPATAEPDGYTAEKAKGNVLMLAPGAKWRCSMEFGALDANGAKAMRKRIEAVKAG